MDIPFIDIHTHHPVNSEEIISVSNLFLQDIDLQNDISVPFSAAIHPWHTAKFDTNQVIAMLDQLVLQPHLIAIGETGLDKLVDSDDEHQKKIFELHLEYADFHHKPLIIHAVKSWNELIPYLKKAKVPFILHGYSAGKELTKQLADLGCYFSLGKSVMNRTPRYCEVIKLIPPTTLFLETDDSQTNIKDIYGEVSRILDISLQGLKIQIQLNYEQLFG